jgi:type IX secretion system PorP/SprF family membrane protein
MHLLMKNFKLFFLIGGMLIAGMCVGQQQRLYTMFMYNKLGLNPAYAGYHEHGALNAVYRSQWIGLEGAPESMLVSFHTPFGGKRIGFGMSLSRESIGISSQTTLDGIYAYKVPVGNGLLSLGAQASVRSMEVDYTDPSVLAIEDLAFDQGVDLTKDNRFVANFGAGIYLHTPKFYVGVSSPRMMKSDIDFEENNLFIAREERHWYGMTGVVMTLSPTVDLVPQVLARYSPAAPLNFDVNASLIWKRDYSFGFTYRTGGADGDIGDSVDFIASAKVARGLMLALAYDLTLSELNKYSNGSVEVMLRYIFHDTPRQGVFVDPRYF